MSNQNSIVEKLFPDLTKLISQGKCPLCKDEVDILEFRTNFDLEEYKVSGLCQECLDDVWGKEK